MALKDEFTEHPERFVLVVRYYSEPTAQKEGRSWAPSEMLTHANPRAYWGIPNVNKMTDIAYGAIRTSEMGEGIYLRAALPLDGQPGGGPEYVITAPIVARKVMIYYTAPNRGPR